MKNRSRLVAALMAVVIFCGCGSKKNDRLQAVMNRGTLVVGTDQQTAANDETQFGPDNYMDREVAKIIAQGLGVKLNLVYFNTDWDVLTAGQWKDAWDVVLAGMSNTIERSKDIKFIDPPYYVQPAHVITLASNSAATLGDLAGKVFCNGTGEALSSWYTPESATHGFDPKYIRLPKPAGISVKFLEEECQCLPLMLLPPSDADHVDAMLAEDNDFEKWNSFDFTADDLALCNLTPSMKDDLDLKIVGDPVLGDPISVPVSKYDSLDTTSFVTKLTQIMQNAKTSGQLKALSETYFQADYSPQ